MARLHLKNKNQKDAYTSPWSKKEAIMIRVWELTWTVFVRWMPYKEALEAVATELNVSKASVTSYLPYKKGVYFRENCEREQISVVAEGLRRMRQRKKAVEVLQSSHDEQHLWKCIVAFQGYRFKTISGLPFSYKIKTRRNGELTKELWIDRREGSKSLTWSSILLAFEKTEGKPLVKRPKTLGEIRGVSYIYGMFK